MLPMVLILPIPALGQTNQQPSPYMLLMKADSGDVKSQTEVAFDYMLGINGFIKSPAEAARYYRKAAEQGNVQGQVMLGNFYSQGTGVIQDYREALRWYRKAAEEGNLDAQIALGEMYEKGQGTPQDYSEALRWYRDPAQRGRGDAQLRLGQMYFYGRGVEKDLIQAHMWVNLSIAGLNPSPFFSRSINEEVDHFVRELRDQIAAQMTAAQIAEAQRLAREWKPSQPK